MVIAKFYRNKTLQPAHNVQTRFTQAILNFSETREFE